MQQAPWKAWYKLRRWQDLRLKIFRRDLYTCQCGCGMMEGQYGAAGVRPQEAASWG
jgi:5-methylcytosine-specific restriction enzyme A